MQIGSRCIRNPPAAIACEPLPCTSDGSRPSRTLERDARAASVFARPKGDLRYTHSDYLAQLDSSTTLLCSESTGVPYSPPPVLPCC